MYNMPGTPVTCCSIGAATVSATTWALAPGYGIDTLTDGGVIRGYCAIGKNHSAIPPVNVMITDRTVAKMGRSMKNLETIFGRYAFTFSAYVAGRRLKRYT